MFPLPLTIVEKREIFTEVNTVTFSDIDKKRPSGARHLVIIINASSPDAVDSRETQFQFNGDGGANYSRQYLRGVAATPDADSDGTLQTSLYGLSFPGTNYGGGLGFGGGSFLIPDAFATNKFKTMLALGGPVEYVTQAIVGIWEDTSEITSVTININAGNFAVGSEITLAVVDENYLFREISLEEDGLVSFENLPDVEGDILIIAAVRTDRTEVNDGVDHEINDDDTAANYARQSFYGTGTSELADSGNTQLMGDIAGDNSVANAFGALIAIYSQFAKITGQPHFYTLSGYFNSGGPNSTVSTYAGRRSNTEAITKLEFSPTSGTNFKAGSVFSCYIVPKKVIERVELTASQAVIPFRNIPQDYEVLMVHIYCRSDRAAETDNVGITINGDTTDANYDYQRVWGLGGAVGAERSAASRILMHTSGATEGADEFAAGTAWFPGYARNDRHKHIFVLNGRQENMAVFFSSRWESTSPIKSIDLFPQIGANFVTGTVAELCVIGEPIKPRPSHIADPIECVLSLPMDEGKGQYAYDHSGFGAHARLGGGNQGNMPGWVWVPGIGWGLAFTSSRPDYLEIPASFTQLEFTSEDFSIIVGVYNYDLFGGNRLFIRGLSVADGYDLEIGESGIVYFSTFQAGASQDTYTAAGSIAINTHYTIGMSRTGASAIICINGVDVTSVTFAHINPTTSARTAKIGIYDDLTASALDGIITFLYIFRKALTEAEHMKYHLGARLGPVT